MGQSDEAAGAVWPATWAVSIGRNIATARKAQGVTAQQLADRCSELGYPIARSTIANIESGRKRDIPVQEVAAIARALGVPPVRLLFDLRAGDVPVEVLPGVEALPVEGMEWFAGRARIAADGSVEVLTNDGTDAGLSNARTERDSRLRALYLVDRREHMRRRLAAAEAGILPPGYPESERLDHLDITGPTDAEWVAQQTKAKIQECETELHYVLGGLRQARAALRASGMTPPSLPDVLVTWVESVGGDV